MCSDSAISSSLFYLSSYSLRAISAFFLASIAFFFSAASLAAAAFLAAKAFASAYFFAIAAFLFLSSSASILIYPKVLNSSAFVLISAENAAISESSKSSLLS
jgi:hypothetical protein